MKKKSSAQRVRVRVIRMRLELQAWLEAKEHCLKYGISAQAFYASRRGWRDQPQTDDQVLRAERKLLARA